LKLGESFCIAQSGRCPDLLVIWGEGLDEERMKRILILSNLGNRSEDVMKKERM
jgi:hypothetical protein